MANILSKNTDEILALIVTVATMVGYYTNVQIPTEPLMIVLGYYFGKQIPTK